MNEDGTQRPKPIAEVLKDLQPIRDLAKNWDIDIASCLEEYLHELVNGVDLEDASMRDDSEDAQQVKTNFAQAALLLHNSSHVYSRKVEYLYSLVNQQLDSLLSVNSQKRASRGRTLDPELEDFRDFDPHQEFLLLDDVLPTDKSEDCRHINLPSSPSDKDSSRRTSAGTSLLATPRGNVSMRTQNLSGSTIGGRSFHTLSVSKTLSQINAQSNAELRLMDGQCDLDAFGRLLVPGCQSSSQQTFTSPAPPGLAGTKTQEEPAYAPNGDYDEDDYDDGPGFVMADDDDNVGGYEDNQNNSNEQEPLAPQSAKKRVTFAPEIKAETEPERPDPWAMLDPHSTDSRKSRPLKLGKTLRVPPGLDDLPGDCVSGSHTRKWTEQVVLPPAKKALDHKFFATEAFHSLSRKRRLEDDERSQDEDQDAAEDSLPMIPLKGLVYGEEFAYLAREHAQRKAADRRLLRRAREQEQAQKTTKADHNDNLGYDDEDDDYFGGGFAYGDDGDDDDDTGPVLGDTGSPVVETNTGLQAVDDAYREPMENAGDDEATGAQSFEELCREHIAKFAKGAEKYASETQLTQRVDQWQAKLEPLLTEEETRPEFDIHEYGRSILETVGGVLTADKADLPDEEDAPAIVNFTQVTKECPNYQVCRYFLASLSLCNAGNLLLEQAGGSTNSLSIKLLSKDLTRPMETYQAPSVAAQNT